MKRPHHRPTIEERIEWFVEAGFDNPVAHWLSACLESRLISTVDLETTMPGGAVVNIVSTTFDLNKVIGELLAKVDAP